MAVVDRGGPWLAIWVNGNIRNLDQPAENYMQPYSMRRSGKAQRWTKHQRCKTSKAQQWKPSKTSAVQNQNGKHLPSKNLDVCYILYDCTMVRWYNGTYQRKAEAPPAKVVQLNINGRQKNYCTTATINARQKKRLYDSNYQRKAEAPPALFSQCTCTSVPPPPLPMQGKYCEMSKILLLPLVLSDTE